jgi:hypothetical protein
MKIANLRGERWTCVLPNRKQESKLCDWDVFPLNLAWSITSTSRDNTRIYDPTGPWRVDLSRSHFLHKRNNKHCSPLPRHPISCPKITKTVKENWRKLSETPIACRYRHLLMK